MTHRDLPWTVAWRVAGFGVLAVGMACSPERQVTAVMTPSDVAVAQSNAEEWTTPVNLGAVINTASNELTPALSVDGLSLYFSSDRNGPLGLYDIWVAKRGCASCEWEKPVNVVALNSAGTDYAPALSPDGQLLFFQSNRPGGFGAVDLYVSRRQNVQDDLGWESPVNLGPLVNTTLQEAGAHFVVNDQGHVAGLYFHRGTGAVPGSQDIYFVPMTLDGMPTEAATPVQILNVPGANDRHVFVRQNGRELMFETERGLEPGWPDIWVSRRQNRQEPWGAPEPLLPPEHSFEWEGSPWLLRDGRTLFFDSFRSPEVGGFGRGDIWMTTRRNAR